MKRLLIALGLVLAAGSAFAGGSTTPATVITFNDEVTAQTRCPLDTVVWLDTHSHLYYKKHARMYANTAHGGFACMKEVREAGNKPAAR